jgi:glyoxylase-like metal-dependent hydrolase (beta-lactamase superfamily II)
MTRRESLVLISSVACGLLIPGRLALASRMNLIPQDPAPTDDFLIWRKAGEGAFVGVGSGGNSTVILGKDCGILVDCKNAPYGECLKRESLKRAKSLKLVVNTHHHGDHTGGNHAFSKTHEIVAHDKCTERVLKQMNRYTSQLKEAASQIPEGDTEMIKKVRAEALDLYKRVEQLKVTDFAPKTTFATTREIDFPGLKATLHHLGQGHTDNDIIVHVPEQNLIVAGDLLFNKMHPFVDKDSGANTRAWQATLKKVLELCDAKTVVVPGHGDVTDANGVKAQIAYFDTVRDFVAGAIKEGKTRAEVGKLALPKYGDYGLKNMAASGIQTVFDELAAEKAPAAK